MILISRIGVITTLRIFEFDKTEFEKGCIAVLHEAAGVKVTHELNADYTLEFTYPFSEKAETIRENRIVVCEGQVF